jgi:16S rRNA (guanine966-N2)-methyltransferase
MRIISGKYRGKRFYPPTNLPVRPTTDFAKEGLFNYLANRINLEGIKVLDLFSGTGNITIEFASRGAGEITSVDQNLKCSAYLKKIAGELQLKNLKVVNQDAFRYIGFSKEKFDLIFADPPYELNNAELLPKIIFEKDLLNEEGLLILEHSEERNFEKHPNFFEQRRYGKVNFSFFTT